MSEMDTLKIEEAKQTACSQDIRLRRARGKTCIYYPSLLCSIPKLQFKICRSCPCAAQYIRANVVAAIFKHIKSLAISFLRFTEISG